MSEIDNLVRRALRRTLTDARRAALVEQYPPAQSYFVGDPDTAHQLTKLYPAACVMYRASGDGCDSVYIAGQPDRLILRTGMSLDDL